MMLSGEVLEEIYVELHRLASSFLRNERAHHTLQPSALINEAYLRLVEHKTMPAVDRAHFLRQAARAMRHVLIDYARQKRARKRDHSLLEPAQDYTIASFAPEDYLTIDAAVKRLEEWDARQAEIVELRFFGGLSAPEIAEALDISEKTVKREWAMARAWLRTELERQTN
ncbi:MAG: sigma-70 family RNA polymerase sigma factor [Bryobacteraceae bacterium]|nr:sigma-70 family RNA polymerase sigma factor [Bryobacteraceae bacterium]